jgi:hypothetical protein
MNIIRIKVIFIALTLLLISCASPAPKSSDSKLDDSSYLLSRVKLKIEPDPGKSTLDERELNELLVNGKKAGLQLGYRLTSYSEKKGSMSLSKKATFQQGSGNIILNVKVEPQQGGKIAYVYVTADQSPAIEENSDESVKQKWLSVSSRVLDEYKRKYLSQFK